MYKQLYVNSNFHWDLHVPFQGNYEIMIASHYNEKTAEFIKNRFFTDLTPSIQRLRSFLFFDFDYKKPQPEYKDWVKIWKRKYNKLSKIIRFLKNLRKKSNLEKYHLNSLSGGYIQSTLIDPLTLLASQMCAARKANKALYKERQRRLNSQ